MQDFDELDDLSQAELEYLDAVIMAMAEQMEEYDERTSFLNLDTQKLILASFMKLKEEVSGDNVKISRVFHKPYQSMGYISITGKNIVIKNPKTFAAILKLASSTEVYPKTDGSIQINLTYHGLTKPID